MYQGGDKNCNFKVTVWSKHHQAMKFVAIFDGTHLKLSKHRKTPVLTTERRIKPGSIPNLFTRSSTTTKTVQALKMNFLLIAGLLGGSLADIFMTNPKGSNNRLNENSVNRANGNRMFDSQNNNKGGYNVGEAGVEANNDDHTQQFQMLYYGSGAGAAEESQLIVEWAHQHGCGDNPKSQCNNVIQYMCMNQGSKNDYPAGAKKTQGDRKKRGYYMRDGIDTGTQKYVKGPNRHEKTGKQFIDRIRNAHDALDADKGLHESLTWYDMCRYREANNRLFTADQNLAQDRRSRFDNKKYSSSRITRQNPGGTQRGLECPEERDYYPYWQPTLQGKYDAEYQRTPWIDAAYLGDKSNCPNVLNNSFNNRRKFRCVLPGARSYGKSIHKAGCLKEKGKWVAFESFLEVLENVNTEAACNKIAAKNQVNNVVWRPLRSDSTEAKCIVKAPQPFCGPAATTRVNQLGNALTDPLYASRYNLRLPHFPSGETKRCVLRVRYNITTGDYDPQNTFADSNGQKSPV